MLCRNTGASEGGTSPRDASPITNDTNSKEAGSKKAQLMAKVSLFSQVSGEVFVWSGLTLYSGGVGQCGESEGQGGCSEVPGDSQQEEMLHSANHCQPER